jgi:glutamyl/glutaminyl-tRNA synthetase
VSQYQEDGFLAEAMVNYLILLGWSAPDSREIFDRAYAAGHFALDRVNAAPAVFDPQKLEWMNGQYIHAMSAAELKPLVSPFFDVPWLEEGIDVVKTSVTRLTLFREALRFVAEYNPPAIDRTFAEALRDELKTNGTPHDVEAVKAMNERLKKATGLKGKELFMPLRLAVTGLDHGPELVRAIPLLLHASEVDPSVLSPLARIERCIA